MCGVIPLDILAPSPPSRHLSTRTDACGVQLTKLFMVAPFRSLEGECKPPLSIMLRVKISVWNGWGGAFGRSESMLRKLARSYTPSRLSCFCALLSGTLSDSNLLDPTRGAQATSAPPAPMASMTPPLTTWSTWATSASTPVRCPLPVNYLVGCRFDGWLTRYDCTVCPCLIMCSALRQRKSGLRRGRWLGHR